MPDLVVTVPKALWADWLAEGDLPGEHCPKCDGWGGYHFPDGTPVDCPLCLASIVCESRQSSAVAYVRFSADARLIAALRNNAKELIRMARKAIS